MAGPWDDYGQSNDSGGEPWSEYGDQPDAPKSGIGRRLVGDTAISALKSAIAVPEAAVGIADLVTGGQAGKILENEGGIGFRPKEAKATLDEYLSPEQKAANAKLGEAEGFVDTLSTAIDNPSTILHTGVESIAPMLAGGVVARGVMAAPAVAGKLAPWAAGAIGEGVVSAGMGAESLRQQTEDGLLTGEQAGLAGLAGVGTGLIGAGGAKIAQKLGIGEIDTLLAGGNAGATTTKGIARKVAEGAAVEGVFQELPQSTQEQALQNIALGKPWDEGLGNAAAMGLLTGAALGGIAGPLGGKPLVQPTPTAENPAPAPVPAPDPNAGAISRTAALLPAPSIAGLLPDPGQTLYGDSEGNWTNSGQARNFDRDIFPTGREQGPRDFGPGMDRQAGGNQPADGYDYANHDENTLEGEIVTAREVFRAQRPLGIPDMRADSGAINVSPDGTAVPGKIANTPPKNYVPQGGPGMDQQREVGKTYKGLPAANRAIRNAANPEQLEAVKVGPQTFEVRPKAAEPEAPRPVLQNRDRSTPASITQMRSIAARPDYQRVSISRDFANGAPVVEPGAAVPSSRKGRTEVASTASGRKIKTQYAVVEASDLLPSHDINGGQNTEYATGAKGKSRAIAGNGRVTGISHAYAQGTASEYRRELEADAAGHGISAKAIKGMKQPVLVRIMPQDQITQGIGDESNTTGVSGLSGSERAMNDARRINIDDMEFSESGEISETTVRQFVQSMPDAERNDLLDGARPSRQAYDRAESAIFASAYESESLIALQAQAKDPEVRTVLSGLLVAAPKMARLKGAGEWDIRGLVVEAAEAAVNARRNGQTLEQYAQQVDLDRSPEAQFFIELFAENIRSAKRIGEELSAVADGFYTEAAKPEFDMLGAVPRRSRQDLLNGAPDADTTSTPANSQTAGNQAGTGTAAADEQARDAERAEPAGAGADAQAEAFQLNQQTEEELAAADAANKARIKAEEKAQAEADEKKRKADEAAFVKQQNEAANAGFQLGQNAEDNLTGQGSIFDAPPVQAEPATVAAKPDEADAQRFIPAPDGSTDFGEITSDMAKAAGRQAGKIRLQQGNESWGLQHIEQRHGAEIRDAGFADVPAFVADIAQHIDQVWKPAATRQLVALHAAGKNRVMFVELQPGRDEGGDFYTVKTAFPARPGYTKKEKWKLLWEARAQASGESGNRPSFAVSPPIAGGEVTIPSSQSSEPSIAPPVDDKPAAKPKAKPAAKPDAKVEDVGDQLKFNKKGMFRSGGLKWSDIASENDALKVKLAGKEKIWSRPNWEQIIEAQPADQRDGFRMAAHLTKQVYDALPKQAPVKTDEGIQQYIDAVTELRTAAEAFLSDSDALASVLNGLSQKAASRMSGSFSILDMQAGNKTSTAPLFAALFPEQAAGKRFERGTPANTKGQMIGSKAIKAMQWGTDDAVKAMKAIKAGWPAKQEAWEKQGYAVHLLDTALTGRYFGMDDGKIAAHLLLGGRSTDELGIFDTRQKAEAAVEAKSKELVGQFLVLDKRKRLLGSFLTEGEATDFARAQVARKAEPEQQAAEQTSDDWDARTGEQRRPENKDVSPEELMEAFGFRGVNFGNWVKQGERRRHLNAAYDAFADLADLLGIPPKAVSLNGMLGVAFGAQGGGKFAAHFVPGVNEINITKTRGAGSLAHEWAHALDHYFGTQAGLARSTNPFASTLQGMSKYSRGKLENVQLRPEVEQAFNNIVDVMRSRVETPAEVVKRRQDALQKAKEGAQVVADRLRPRLEGNAEALKALDAVMDGEAGEYVNLPIPKGKRKPIGAIPENIKTVYDALGYSSQEAYDKSYQLHRVALAKEQLGMDMMARSVHTQFYRNSLVLDGKKTPYWSTQWEMFARGFESWVMDALALRGAANSYLVGEGKADEAQLEDSPYPRGSERALLNDAFGKLAAEIKYRQADDGNVPLFSRGAAGAVFGADRGDVAGAAGAVVEHDAVEAIIKRIGARLGLSAPIISYRSEAALFAAVPEIGKQAEKDGAKGQVNAVFYRGKVHVVTGAFARVADVEMAILDALAHEGQGHHGIRAMYGNDAKAVDAALREVFAAIGGVAGVKRLAAKNGLDLSLYLKTADGMSERQRAGYLADELLAHLQGRAATAGLSQRAMAAIKAYLGAVREWLRGHGFPNLAKGTDADIALLLKRMREAAQRKPTGRGLAARFALASTEARFRRAAGVTTDAFKRWFGNSKVVNKQGEPKILYHGTGEDFTVFDQGRSGSSTRHNTAPLGIFITGDRDTAQAYADKASDGIPGYARVMQLYAAIRNPYMMSVAESLAIESPGEAAALRGKLEREGYDGINLKGTDTWVAFSNTQVKSATDNNGEYDEWSGDIRFRRSARDLFDRATGPAPLDNNDPFAEENRRLREGDKTLWQKAKKVFARQFAPGGLLPEAVFNEKITRDSEFQAVEFDVRHLSGGLNKAVNADYGVGVDNLTAEQMKPLAEALTGKVDPAIPEATRVAIVAMRQYIDSLSGEYLDIIQGQIDALQEKAATYGPALKAANDARKALNAAIASDSDPAIMQALAGKKAALAAQVKAKKAMDGLKGEERAQAKAAYEVAVKAHDQAKAALRASLPPELKAQAKAAEALRAEANAARSSSAEAKAESALHDKISANLGAYVNRSYQAFDDKNWFKTVPTEVVNAARTYLANGYMEQGETAAEARRLADVTVNEMLKNGTAYDSMGAFIAEGKLGAKDLTVLIKRKEIAPEIRALLGEYMDPRLNFAKSATKMGRLVWNQRFLDRVLSFGMGTILFEGKNRPADATTQIAGEKSETYAPLNGLWTFPEVAQAFQDALGKEQMSDLYRTVVRLNGMVKYGKTILSPTTAMRNWQSAMFFSLANGHFDLTQMKKSWAAMREQVTQNATGEDLVYLRKLKRLGVVYDTPYAGEMMALLQDARMDELLSSKSGTGLKWLRKANQFAQGFYSFGDDFWKIIGFENEKAGLLKAGIPLAEAEAMAAKRIRDTYPTYSMIGKAIQWLRRFPLAGTFVSFPSEIIRTSVNMLQLTAADLKSDNPGLRAIGRKRAAGIAMVSGGFYALAALTAAAAGVGDDEEEALRDLAAPWSKNSTFLYTGRDADGKLRYFDLSFLDPYGYWKRPLTAMMRDQPWEKAAASGLSDMLSPFFGADITAGAIFEVLANKKPTGGPVFNPDAGSVDQLQDISNHMRKALQPGFMSNGERLLKAFNDERRDGSGQPYDMRDELVSLLGWRASTLDTQTGLYYRSFDFTDALSNARKTLTRTLRSSNTVTDEDIGESKQAANAQYQQAFTEMGRLVSAAQAAGMTRAEVVQTLKTSGIAQANIMALVNGRVPPMQISLAAQAKAVKQARTMRDSEHAAEIARRFRLAREQ